MIAIKKIICAVDLVDDYAPTVAEYAVTMAKAFDSKVVVLYAVPPLNTVIIDMAVETPNLALVGSQMLEAANATMDKFMSSYFGDVKAKAIVKEGKAASEILDVITDEKADLVVIGTRALTGVKKVLYGSVAEKVTKNSPVPVLTITP